MSKFSHQAAAFVGAILSFVWVLSTTQGAAPRKAGRLAGARQAGNRRRPRLEQIGQRRRTAAR